MDERALPLISALLEKYEAIRSFSNWNTLKSISNTDQINALLDKRAALLSEIAALPPLSSIDAENLSGPGKGQYAALVLLVREITDADQWVMAKINGRMNEIREELKTKSLYRNKALPGYMRQKFAIAS
jgi:hypothetical protein